jgi:hypothetical protein
MSRVGIDIGPARFSDVEWSRPGQAVERNGETPGNDGMAERLEDQVAGARATEGAATFSPSGWTVVLSGKARTTN